MRRIIREVLELIEYLVIGFLGVCYMVEFFREPIDRVTQLGNMPCLTLAMLCFGYVCNLYDIRHLQREKK